MRISGTIPEHIRRLMPREERNSKETQTLGDLQEKSQAKSEKELQLQIENWLRLRGVPVYRQRMDRKSNMVLGAPDIAFPWAPWGGKFVGLEVKFERGKQTEDQMRQQKQIIENQGACFVVRSLAEVVEVLNQ